MMNQDFGPPVGQPIDYASASFDHTHAKWRTWGIVFGVIPIVIGSLSGCLGLLIPLALMVPRTPGVPAQPPTQRGAILSGMAVYLIAGALLVWLGIGAVTMRRWVRPMVLTIGTIATVGGLLGIFSYVLMFPTIRTAMAAPPAVPGGAPAMPPGIYTIIMIITAVIMGVLFVIIPGAFVWFYRKPEVKEALEFYDPKARWTDTCPIPVLGLAVGLILYAVSASLTSIQGIAPVFGTVLHGPAAVAVMLVMACVAFVLARLVYRIRMIGWWGTVGFMILVAVAYAMTAMRSDQAELYRAAGYPEEQLRAIQSIWQIGIALRLAVGLPWLMMIFGYLLWVYKYFKAAPNEQRPLDIPPTA